MLKNLALALAFASGPNATVPLRVESGTASFDAGTTVRGVEVTGKSNALTARVEIIKSDAGLTLHHVDAVVPSKSLTTGMKVRDDHMRKYIFQDAAGDLPDLHFTAASASCAAAARAFSCPVTGEFQMRGLTHPFTIELHIKQQSETAFHVDGDGIIKLSDYGIEAPSQFGVKMLNEVKFHIDFKTTMEAK
jgi:polyisoprenoid-binding protein YceI